MRIEMVYRLLEIAPIFNGLFADSVVGATSGRPLPIHSADKTTAQGSLVQRELSAELTEGLEIIILHRDNPSVMASPCHLPLHKGGYLTVTRANGSIIRGKP